MLTVNHMGLRDCNARALWSELYWHHVMNHSYILRTSMALQSIICITANQPLRCVGKQTHERVVEDRTPRPFMGNDNEENALILVNLL